jgi:hypothetical protein
MATNQPGSEFGTWKVLDIQQQQEVGIIKPGIASEAKNPSSV